MIITSHKQPPASSELITFLQQKLGVTESSLELALRQADLEQAPLPIILWSFGLLSLEQYQEVLDWQLRH